MNALLMLNKQKAQQDKNSVDTVITYKCTVNA